MGNALLFASPALLNLLMLVMWFSPPMNEPEPTTGNPRAGGGADRGSAKLAQSSGESEAGWTCWATAQVWSGGLGEPTGHSKRGVRVQAPQVVLSSAVTRAVASSDWLEQQGMDCVTFWEVQTSASSTSGLILGQHSCVTRALAASLHLSPLPFPSSRPKPRHSNGQSKNETVLSRSP